MALKIKIKKNTLVRKIDGVKKTGYYGKVIANGTKSFEDIVKQSTHGSTLDYREAELACKMMIDGIADSIKQGYIVDLGVLGKLYPAVSGTWKQDPEELAIGYKIDTVEIEQPVGHITKEGIIMQRPVYFHINL